LYNIKDKTINDADILKKLNDRIIETKGHDFQIGHSFFMGCNGGVYELDKTMNNKVIPLLLEYYMNDEKEVRAILQAAGLTIDENVWPLRITGRDDKSI
jgi:5-methylcytosine-specific restriction protein B